MTWTTPPTLTDGQVLTGAHTQIWRDDLNETPAAKFTASGQTIFSTAPNASSVRVPTKTITGTGALETTTSTTYVNLTTVGPTVSSLATGSWALCCLFARFFNNTAGESSFMGVDVSGSSAVTAIDQQSVAAESSAASDQYYVGSAIMVAITAGTNTFQGKYRVTGGTGSWMYRTLSVLPF